MEYTKPTTLLAATGEQHLETVQAVSGVSIRFYDDELDRGIPPTLWAQPVVDDIIRCEREAVRAEEAGLPIPAHVVAQRGRITAELEPKTLVVGAMVIAALHASEEYRDSLIVMAPDTKSIESAGTKIGRRLDECDSRPISDFHRTMVVRARAEGEPTDEEADRQFMAGVLEYLRRYFRVPEVDEHGQEAISTLGNPSSSSEFEGGLQARLKFVIDGEVVLFEAIGLTKLQHESYPKSHGLYEEQRGAKRQRFRQLLLGGMGDKVLMAAGAVS